VGVADDRQAEPCDERSDLGGDESGAELVEVALGVSESGAEVVGVAPGVGDVALQGVFWTIGLAVPALLMFAIGGAVAPVHQQFSDNLCALGGLEGGYDPDDRTDSALEDALEAIDDCGVRAN